MENKQIIIDGVDVSGCKHYENHTLYDCNETCEINGGIVCTKCKEHPNCYYKQLQREKQSSQEARDTAIKEFNRAEELKTLLKHKEQKLIKIKQYIYIYI